MKNYEKTYKRKSTWEFNPEDDYVKETDDTVGNTIETWVWDDEEEYNGEMGCYVLDKVEIAETGEEIILYEVQKESGTGSIKLHTIKEAVDYSKEHDMPFELTKTGLEFFHDEKMYPAQATLFIYPNGTYHVGVYEYYNGELWLPTGDNSWWTDEEINDTFFSETTDEVEITGKKIQETINEYKALQAREINPVGHFDNAGRWYPSEKQSCCEGIRNPSRAYPYSLMIHCRSLKHVCTKNGVDYSEVKKIMKNSKGKVINS